MSEEIENEINEPNPEINNQSLSFEANVIAQPSFLKMNKSKIILIVLALATMIITAILLIAVYIDHSKQEEIIKQEETAKEQELIAEQEEISKQEEKAKDSYIASVEKFQELCFEAGTNLNILSLTLQDYWYDAIYENKHDSEIEQAITDWRKDMKVEIASAKEEKSSIDSFYDYHIKNFSDAVEGDSELVEIHDATKDLYYRYSLFYYYTLKSYGMNYTTFTAKRTSNLEEFIEKYFALDSIS